MRVQEVVGVTEQRRYNVRVVTGGGLYTNKQEGIGYSRFIRWECDKVESTKRWKVVTKASDGGSGSDDGSTEVRKRIDEAGHARGSGVQLDKGM